ncbi:MAG: hypothetical protein Q9170_002269 [Blastenia crenularia]
MVQLASILNFAALFYLAAAECDLPGGARGGQETEPAVCMNQGDGYYTFGMTTDLTSLGLQGSTVANYALQIMDNHCNILAIYNPSSCGYPAVIKENFLQYVLTVDAVDSDVGNPYFGFAYANGYYTIGNNGCVCSDIGQPQKRGIAFEA